MPLSVYVHIPYCLQRCRYCDFTTFEWSEILPPERYVDQVLEEIRQRHMFWPQREIATLYFGGGTPSLLTPELIVSICRELANVGFIFGPQVEITIEINPATLTAEKLEAYLKAGINRFSVGAQTFNDSLLALCGRKHSAADTRHTLRMIQDYNYSFDLLFALPGQTHDDLKRDLEEVASFSPPHLSAYCLTVPEGHPLQKGRPLEEQQIEMFHLIESSLTAQKILKYEISNFARPGFESRHNGVYWRDESYWGIGLSAHSYARELGPMGMRFWNPKSLTDYARQVSLRGEHFENVLPAEQREHLATHEAMTDFCHMFLRTMRGMPEYALRQKFGRLAEQVVFPRLQKLKEQAWLQPDNGHWSLTAEGQLISNKVFEELTFLPTDLPPLKLTHSLRDSYCAV